MEHIQLAWTKRLWWSLIHLLMWSPLFMYYPVSWVMLTVTLSSVSRFSRFTWIFESHSFPTTRPPEEVPNIKWGGEALFFFLSSVPVQLSWNSSCLPSWGGHPSTAHRFHPLFTLSIWLCSQVLHSYYFSPTCQTRCFSVHLTVTELFLWAGLNLFEVRQVSVLGSFHCALHLLLLI